MLVNSGSLALKSLKSNMASEFYLLECVVYIYSPRRNLSVTFLGFEFFFLSLSNKFFEWMTDGIRREWLLPFTLQFSLVFLVCSILKTTKCQMFIASLLIPLERNRQVKRERDGGSHLHIICPDKSLRHPRCKDKKLFSAKEQLHTCMCAVISSSIFQKFKTPHYVFINKRLQDTVYVGTVPTQFHNHFAISPLKKMVESLLLIQS